MKEGDYFEGGPFEVSNVKNSDDDKGNMTKFWEKHTKGRKSLTKQKCGISGCSSDAQDGGHMWIKNLSKFCFILPICEECKLNSELKYPKFKETKNSVRLVAHQKTPGMSEELKQSSK